MKRAGFTMIELIFVIVILGILAAVALPKFIGVSEQAHNSKVDAFVGTLNRTVGPALWAQSISGTIGTGLVTTLCDTQAELLLQLDTIPEELSHQNDCTFDANTTAGGKFGVDFMDGNATSAPRWKVSDTASGAVTTW
ncbi:MAG: type II secretion system protein [Sulfurimonas sp.]|uniref:type II secretion system protein n=1 Tax=Sulfurimonas sp. TaxID=2022749 RepID=UPI00262BE77C|nr:type II secretion system protein [Sulfurimonas sp.]MDD2652126.1 type II secretion system protein [Sulfurimonas sp.]MDD3451964.1 type II secretion system protein [Sulfurimonas sp.]